MRAAVVTSFDEPLVIKEVPLPEPGPGQVRVRIEASGLCHTDIHAARGDWPVKPAPPFVPGHEGVGIVEKVGTRADLAEVFRLHSAGRTRVSYEPRRLDNINAAIEDVLAGRVPARLVLLP